MKALVLIFLPSLALAEATPSSAPADAPRSTAQGQAVVEKPPQVSPLKAAPDVSLSPLRLLPSDLDRIEHRARIRRNTGIGLAIPGVALLVLGSVLIGTGAHDVARLAGDDREIDGGIITAGIGIVLTIPGAYLWVDGQDSLDTAAWRRRRATP